MDTVTATTIARLVGAASRKVTAGAVRWVTMALRQIPCVRGAWFQSAFLRLFSCVNASMSPTSPVSRDRLEPWGLARL
ncbi:hypothetical protein A5709_04870 [Mycobacterium sp. E1386]|nr:hypothetical protein A5709_04870 [Mycobacterium sp. E1386]